MRLQLFGLIALALWATAPSAHANGRFPRALRLQESSDAQQFAVYGTYGLLLSDDAGQNWRYVCESATGIFNGESAVLEPLPDGQWLLGTDLDLKRSEAGGCDWLTALQPDPQSQAVDATRSKSEDGVLYALQNVRPNVGRSIGVWRSADAAQHFELFAELPATQIERGLTLDVAPSDADRLYVSGIDPRGRGVVTRLDAGTDAQTFLIPLTSAAAAPYIAAVHPTDPDKLFVRTDELVLLDNTLTANDRLWYSNDGGHSWVMAFERHGKLLGFALSPDGDTVLLGYGDPVLFSYAVQEDELGIYRLSLADLDAAANSGAVHASDAGVAADAGAPAAGSLANLPADRISSQSVTCLSWTESALYACFTQEQTGFEVGRTTTDAAKQDSILIFCPMLDLTRILPLQCDADSTAGICEDDISGWPSICTTLGADCDGTEGDADAGAGPKKDDAGGCGCTLPGRGRFDTSALIGLAGLGLLFAARRVVGRPRRC